MNTTPAHAMRILLVDDDEVDTYLIRELLQTVIGEEQFDLRKVTCAKDAERDLASGEIDIALVDLHLSDGMGPVNVARVRAAAPTVPIIALTGLDSPEGRAACMEAGARAYLSKVETRPGDLARAGDRAPAGHSVNRG